jgi:hypothetical protein
MFRLLELYPKQTSFLVGFAIGLGNYIVSRSLCVFASGCANGNPFFPLATFFSSRIVGIYCSCLVKGKIKYLVSFVVTLLTILAVLQIEARKVFDQLLGGESVLSHSVLYGFITLIFAFAISLLNKSQASQ